MKKWFMICVCEEVFGVMNGVVCVVALAVLGMAVYQVTFRRSNGRKPAAPVKSRVYQTEELGVPEIEPLLDFEWDKTEPIKYRPMKRGEYKMSMGIRSLPAEEQFVIDRSYLNKTNARRNIIAKRGDEFIFCHPDAHEAVSEYYNHVVKFMLSRYPTCFKLGSDGKTVENLITAEEFRASAEQYGDDYRAMLVTLARHVEDDVVILMKDESLDEYVLKAGIFLLPSGFKPKNLVGLNLSAIHKPVPQYREKLQLAMNKFFNRVKPYQFVCRNNWSIQTHPHLNDTGLNHGKPGTIPKKLKADELDFNKVFLRSERQVVTRLPNSKAVNMTIKTYFTPLQQLRQEEESRELLCSSIEGLSGDLAVYKNKLKWDQAVVEYLNYKSDGLSQVYEEFIFND